MPEVNLALVILAVTDLKRAVQFYRAAFGWRHTVDVPVYAEFELPNAQRVGVYERRAFAANTGATPHEVPPGELAPAELYFYCDDLPGAVARVMGAGARELSPAAARTWGDEVAYFADPDGNVLALARKRRL